MTPVMRRWQDADAPALLAAAAGSPDLVTQLGGAELSTAGACARFIADVLAPSDARSHHLAVVVEGRAVGNVGLADVDPAHDTGWVFYWTAADHRGRGLASRGLASLARWAFTELGLFRLELGHRVNNPASCAVARAAGFPSEGVERAKLRYGTERFDVETHARLATDPDPPLDLIPLVGPG